MTPAPTKGGFTNRPYDRVGYDRREAFVRHFLIHCNASRAYREAGYKDGPGTRQSAHRLLTSADIQARIAEARQGLLAALDVTVEDVVRRFRDIAFADIASIVGLHIGACRFCYGVGHAYQWRSPTEYETYLAEEGQSLAVVDVPEGGYGYDANRLANVDCPMCDGDGIPKIKLKDTRLLTESQRAVLAGIKETPYGIQHRFHNQVEALKELAKRLGFYEARDDCNTNVVARLISELQSRGHIKRIPLRLDVGPSE